MTMPAARPSMLSSRFTALVIATIQKNDAARLRIPEWKKRILYPTAPAIAAATICATNFDAGLRLRRSSIAPMRQRNDRRPAQSQARVEVGRTDGGRCDCRRRG